jgi:hypothetical protein
VELFWVPGHLGVCGNEITDGLAREGSVHQFVEPEPALRVSRKNARRKSKGWIDNQHTAVKQGLTSTERQAQNLISGPGPTAKTRLLSLNRIQSRVFTGFLTGPDTLRTYLYIMGVIDNPLCRRYGAEEESSAHVLYECEVLATLKHTYFGFFFLGPEDVRSHYSILFYSILFYSILFYSILFYSILFYSVLFYSILFYSILILAKYYEFRSKLLFSEDSLTETNVIRAYHIHLLSSYVAKFIT